MRQSRLLNIFIINSDVNLHKITKIISISLISFSLIAAISSMSIPISLSLLGAGLVSAIATKIFSKGIQSKFNEISNLQKTNNFENNYELTSNKLFYNKIKTPSNSIAPQTPLKST